VSGTDKSPPRWIGRLEIEPPLEVAIDFDGVLFEQAPHVREKFSSIHGIDVGPAEQWPADLLEHPPIREAGLDADDTWEVFHAVHTDHDLHESSPRDEHACRVLTTLEEAGHRVDVVTARSGESREQTRSFLERNEVPHTELVMDDQEKTGHDILLDDLPRHVDRAAKAGSLALLMDQPYNRAYEANANPRRVGGFAELEEIVTSHLEP
jgi:uncharacterized HAD superfamily protein